MPFFNHPHSIHDLKQYFLTISVGNMSLQMQQDSLTLRNLRDKFYDPETLRLSFTVFNLLSSGLSCMFVQKLISYCVCSANTVEETVFIFKANKYTLYMLNFVQKLCICWSPTMLFFKPNAEFRNREQK